MRLPATMNEPEELLALSLYLLQLCQMDLNMGRTGTIWARAYRARLACEALEKMYAPEGGK